MRLPLQLHPQTRSSLAYISPHVAPLGHSLFPRWISVPGLPRISHWAPSTSYCCKHPPRRLASNPFEDSVLSQSDCGTILIVLGNLSTPVIHSRLLSVSHSTGSPAGPPEHIPVGLPSPPSDLQSSLPLSDIHSCLPAGYVVHLGPRSGPGPHSGPAVDALLKCNPDVMPCNRFDSRNILSLPAYGQHVAAPSLSRAALSPDQFRRPATRCPRPATEWPFRRRHHRPHPSDRAGTNMRRPVRDSSQARRIFTL